MSHYSDEDESEAAHEMFGSEGGSRRSLSPPRQVRGNMALYFNGPVGARPNVRSGSTSSQDVGGGQRQGPHNQNMGGGEEDDQDEGPAGNGLYGYDVRHMGSGIDPKPPRFRHANASQSPWQDFEAAGLEGVKPVRSLVLANIPVAAFARDATRFVHWQTPMANPTRAVNLAALLGLIFTPLSKGWP